MPVPKVPRGDGFIGSGMELGAIKGRDGRGAIAHGRAEESAFSGRPYHDSGLLRTDVNRLIEERLDSPDGAANALQIGLARKVHE